MDFWLRNLNVVLGKIIAERGESQQTNLLHFLSASPLNPSQPFDSKPLFSPSDSKYSPKPLSCYSIRSHAKCFPHPEKIQTGGEDAHFFTNNSCGVFDGVGGWANVGVYDAAAFASGLMTETRALALLSEASAIPFHPHSVLEAAFEKVISANIGGSSTALVFNINPMNGCLTASLIGDSIFIVVRKKQIVYRAPTQQHYFNCPFQLGKDSDKPVDAWQIEFQLEEGDIIISASDGFWDNFFEDDILRSLWVYERTGPAKRVESFSRYLADRAYENSLKKTCLTPFSLASKMAGFDHRGGKVDDISVVVSEVIFNSS